MHKQWNIRHTYFISQFWLLTLLTTAAVIFLAQGSAGRSGWVSSLFQAAVRFWSVPRAAAAVGKLGRDF